MAFVPPSFAHHPASSAAGAAAAGSACPGVLFPTAVPSVPAGPDTAPTAAANVWPTAAPLPQTGPAVDSTAAPYPHTDIAASPTAATVPDEKVELDPTIFDDEFDTKAAFSFNKDQKWQNGVEKEFEKMKNGEIPIHYADDEEPEEANWTKMPQSLNEFNSLRMAVAA